ncbi:SMP-30/gluconolactonase/LRE family protein [Xanthobacter autotrophicus]|uniref:SMP-30/gluconolactonase/LRE family protein n=1 Tax=Xanthobacter autotrophicus TaxID=280 RepID=UPI001E433445|nr:SMP-30/gluconolactonase/LRE family protein [Xanthobacter autotrophicus]UDQ90889.1 SMP-30/gluconolactonase/LRE family protein [Xanthobacter autotrophicus]
MFAAPPAVVARPFVVMPDALRIEGRRSEWSEVQFGGVPLTTFLEGPSFDRAGNLWVVDIPWGRLIKVTPQGKVSVEAEYDGEPNGLKFHKDGRGFIADHRHGIMVFDPATGRVEPYLERAMLQRFKGVNDLIFAANGDLYFTDQGQTGLHDPSGCLYRLRTDGRLDCVLKGIPSPNGLVFNKAETVLFLAVTRANAIWRVPLMRDGTASKVGTFIQLSGGGGPDGLAIDEEDNLVICHMGLGSVWLFSALGEPMLRIRSPEGHLTTNCAFGGPDNRTLFITESKTGTILCADLPVPGRRMYSHA